MLAGLSREERIRLNLEGFSVHNLNYLQSGDTCQNEAEDAMRFQAWKTCLGILGIPFLDVVRVLSAVLLLGNVQFVDGLVCELRCTYSSPSPRPPPQGVLVVLNEIVTSRIRSKLELRSRVRGEGCDDVMKIEMDQVSGWR